MFGDCQVLPSMIGGGGGSGGGNVVSPDPFFSSQIQNPNLGSVAGFMAGVVPFSSFPPTVPLQKEEQARKEEEMESASGSGHLEGLSCGEENDDGTPPPLTLPSNSAPAKKKRYHRHTSRQIQEMEALFKECPHPDDKQRLRLSQELGLKPRQVKFWFQNRRTQMKAQQDRSDNVILRAENDSLKNENYRLQAAIRNVICPNCGGPAMLGEMSFDEHHLRIENARLKEELDRLSCIAGRLGGGGGRSLLPSSPNLLLPPSLDLDMGAYSRQFHDLPPPPAGSCCDMLLGSGLVDEDSAFAGMLIMEGKKPLALELAMAAAEQMLRMSRVNEPLWLKKVGNGVGEGAVEFLDEEEHARLFPWPMELKQMGGGGYRVEGTRDTGLVIMNGITLVDAFMDANQWLEMFPSIVSKAKTIQIITTGLPGNGSGSLHLMYAEFQVLSPLVPTREAYFFRYCQQNVEEGTWTIVDFPVDNLQDIIQMPLMRYRRRPSGCVIQSMPNGYSKVTWIEQAEVEDKPIHQIFSQFVNSGMGFGATRWLSALQLQCERLAALMATNISDLGVISTPEGRKNIIKLSHRMVRTFYASITSSGGQSWTALSDSPDDTIRVTTRKNTLPGQPNGVILSAVSTAWLPFSYHQVFDLLTDQQRRSQLDALSSGNSLHEIDHIANGSHPKNCVSLLRVNAASNSSQKVELLLQESRTHPSGGSLIVYATIDVGAVQLVTNGEDTSYIPLLPTGFVLFPAEQPASASCSNTATNNSVPVGCLLTVGMQVLASAVPSAKLNLSSVTAVNHHLFSAVHQISNALAGSVSTVAPPSLEQQ
ncbi:homeobox-leucine zipper protein ROC3 isoform X2 [Phalaenopsis equestris]|uniref:homeobox-leucine zipper protein ROC3 isoform X2 n=1 Tax=Phalaenopsis equestris TaxID=78828 RepID=UPI0009E40E35|nr:homeobox-leucine zipper protein ROC3 isoform X2 [Phalaenopsis equestris]